MIVGDFNFVFDNSLDRSNPEAKNNTKAMEIVKTYMEETELSDLWRDRNLATRRFTWRQKNPYRASRLDFLFIREGNNKLGKMDRYNTRF